jgi:enoyl-CoA hydratase/carnithine racemase
LTISHADGLTEMNEKSPFSPGSPKRIRSQEIPHFQNLGPIYEWADRQTYLIIDRVGYREKKGALLVYNNPPVHQVATPGLHAFLDGIAAVGRQASGLEYLILYDSNDPLHAGGDLNESLRNLETTLEKKKLTKAAGATAREIDALYGWGEERLGKGVALYQQIRDLAQRLRVLAVCGGGMRFGGSAEIPLMADVLIGDSRGGMCFSEALIGIIPGWGGFTRVLLKAGLTNAAFMAMTAREISAFDLKAIGVYNEVVPIPFPFPRRPRTSDPQKDAEQYQEALEDGNLRTGRLLLPRALELAICPAAEIPSLAEGEKGDLATPEEITDEVERRADPLNYSHLWNRPLREVREEIGKIGRPLARQSLAALERLLAEYDPRSFMEKEFVIKELEADAALYRHPNFLEGLKATLEQRVPDFRSPLTRMEDDLETTIERKYKVGEKK